MRYLNEGLSSRRIREIGNVVNYPKNSVTVYDLIEEKEGITQGENSTLYPLPRLVTAKPGFFILESTPVTVDYLGREGTNEVYMIWGRLAPYVLDSRAVVLIGPGD